jgi:hypothetical protein
MEYLTKNQPHGAFHRLKSSFTEIFGKPETAALNVKPPPEKVDGNDFTKIE